MSRPLVIWWDREKDRDERAREAHRRAMALYRKQGEERKGVLDDALIIYFGNERHTTGGLYTGASGLLTMLGNQLEPPGQNVIQMVVDMMVSHTVHNRVRPFPLTERGDVQAREDAQQMGRAVEGVFHLEGIYGPLGLMTAKLGYIGDGGLVKVIPDYARKKVTLKPVLMHEWLVPDREARKGDPRQGFHIDVVDREMLLEDYGWRINEDGEREKTPLYDAIASAPAAPRDMIDTEQFTDDECSDQVLVIDSYHLPSGYVDLEDESSFGMRDGELDDDVDPKHDGRRMLTIGGGDENGVVCLLDEPYPYDEFNVCEFFPQRHPIGYGSRGVPETLAAGQLAVNRHNKRLEGIMHLHAVARLIAWRQARLNKNKVTNGLADVLESNVPPNQAVQYLQPPGVPRELVERVDKLIAWMKAQYGVNDMSLSGEKPPGLDHAPGMEHLEDSLTLRHTEKSDGWNEFILKLARRVTEACRLLAMRDEDFEVAYFGDDKELVRIKWKDFELQRKKFVMRVWPANLLPQSPGMKLKRIAELVNVFPELKGQLQGALVDQYPDIGAFAGPSNMAEKNIRNKLDRIAREGYSEDSAPHPYVNLALAKTLAAEKINELERDGADAAMENVIQFHEACVNLELSEQQHQAAAMQGQAPPAPPPPMGAPPSPTAPPIAPPAMPT